MAVKSVIRMEADGPAGVGLAPTGYIAPDSVVEGEAVEQGHNYFTDATGRLHAGVWACSPGKERIESYPFDEVCSVQGASVTVTDAAGNAETFGPGDSFVMQHGFKGTRHMTGPFKKVYVILEAAPG